MKNQIKDWLRARWGEFVDSVLGLGDEPAREAEVPSAAPTEPTEGDKLVEEAKCLMHRLLDATPADDRPDEDDDLPALLEVWASKGWIETMDTPHGLAVKFTAKGRRVANSRLN